MPRPAIPGTLRAALLLMRVGAGINTLALLVASTAPASAAVVAAAATSKNSGVGSAALFLTAGIVLWLVVAELAKRGVRGAQVIGTMAFALLTAIVVAAFAWNSTLILHDVTGTTRTAGVANLLLPLMWLVGGPAAVLLWLRSSTAYFRARR
jgi:hypothetical protein